MCSMLSVVCLSSSSTTALAAILPSASGRRHRAELRQRSLTTFEKHGVRRIDALGVKFDPRVHEAVYTLVTATHSACGLRLHAQRLVVVRRARTKRTRI